MIAANNLGAEGVAVADEAISQLHSSEPPQEWSRVENRKQRRVVPVTRQLEMILSVLLSEQSLVNQSLLPSLDDCTKTRLLKNSQPI